MAEASAWGATRPTCYGPSWTGYRRAGFRPFVARTIPPPAGQQGRRRRPGRPPVFCRTSARQNRAETASENWLPRHVGVIMDGNSRWARARGLDSMAGHQRGVESLRNIVAACLKHGIQALTVFAFSSENWDRDAGEVSALMRLMESAIRGNVRELADRGVRLKFAGERGRLPVVLHAAMQAAEAATEGGERLLLTVAVSYGSRSDIVSAARVLAARCRGGELDPGDIDEGMLAGQMSTSEAGDLDLLIRTSGELRLSNFMLWEAAYAELWFTPHFWPDFSADDFEAALDAYQERERRFGRRLSEGR